ncbi:voltage-dependent anion channel [Mycena floridula]|nr:voltage-dependent anion channel [Mycena floridula]
MAFKDVVRNFTPAWFAVTMGTGSISSLFYAFPYGSNTTAFKTLSLIFFFLNLSLFVTFSVITIFRYLAFPDMWNIMMRHSVQSLYIATCPMGATTIINICVDINQDYGIGGIAFLYFVWAVWWLDVILSILCCFLMLHYMETRQKHDMQNMTAAWLFPVVTLVVASSSGGILAEALLQHSISHSLLTIGVSVFMVSVGLTLSFMLLTVYLLRLITIGLPSGATIISTFLPVGSMGQGGYSILLTGRLFKTILPIKNPGSSEIFGSDSAGQTVYVLCICLAFILWSLASMWLVFALLGTQRVVRRTRNIPFKVPFWGLIFPNASFI